MDRVHPIKDVPMFCYALFWLYDNGYDPTQHSL